MGPRCPSEKNRVANRRIRWVLGFRNIPSMPFTRHFGLFLIYTVYSVTPIFGWCKMTPSLGEWHEWDGEHGWHWVTEKPVPVQPLLRCISRRSQSSAVHRNFTRDSMFGTRSPMPSVFKKTTWIMTLLRLKIIQNQIVVSIYIYIYKYIHIHFTSFNYTFRCTTSIVLLWPFW